METNKVEYIHTEVKENVGHIRLVLEQQNNAFNYHLIEQLKKALLEFREDKSVHWVVLQAKGEVFSIGYDLGYLYKLQQYGMDEQLVDLTALAQLYLTLFSFPKCIVAVVEKDISSPAATLVALCDLVIAAPKVNWFFPEPFLGIVPGVEISFLVQLYSPKTVRELFLYPKAFTSEQMQHRGIVTEVTESPQEKLNELIAAFRKGNTTHIVSFLKRMPMDLANVSVEKAIKMAVRIEGHSRLSEETKLFVSALTQWRKK